MNPEVTAAVIAASVSFLTLIGTLAAQYFGRRATGKQLDRTLGEQRTRTLNERFATAAGQLGDDKPPAVRLAGVYAMAGLADDWPENRQTCVDVLCAYLRLRYAREPGDGETAQMALQDDREVRHTVIRVITAHLQKDKDAAMSWQGLNFDFTGAVFDGGGFGGAEFSGAKVSFDSAQFTGDVSFAAVGFSGAQVSFGAAQFKNGLVSFGAAEFSGTTVDFKSAVFSGGEVSFSDAQFRAELSGDDLDNVIRSLTPPDQLSGTPRARDPMTSEPDFIDSGSGMISFYDAKFKKGQVNFSRAKFQNGVVDFSRAEFSGAKVSFDEAEFSKGAVDFSGAEFSGADYSAEDWRHEGAVSFSRAKFCGSTVGFHATTFSEGTVSFYDAEFRKGLVSFGATFSGGLVSFGGAEFFSGSTVSFYHATFSGGTVSFTADPEHLTDAAKFSGGTVNFSDPWDWSFPPKFPWTDTPPPSVKLPKKEDQSQA